MSQPAGIRHRKHISRSRDGPRPFRPRARANLESRGARRCPIIQCRSDAAYSCQLSLLIILNARSFCSLRLVHHSDSERTIGVRRPKAARFIPFDDFLYHIGGRDPFPIQSGHLDTLEESLIAALRSLHAQGISFPVSAEQIELLQPSTSVPGSAACTTLFLPYNKRASWASDKLPPTWQADQLSDARLIFRIAKLLLQLSNPSSRHDLLDLPSQQALYTHLSKDPLSHHVDLCLGVAPVTVELAYGIIHALVWQKKGRESRDALELFFGGPMPLPEPGTPPDTIYNSFLQLRARVCHSGDRRGSTGLDRELEDKLQFDSPAMLTWIICCRAQAATLLKEHDRSQWWRTAMSLYDAFISPTGPTSELERICAFDLYRYRDK